MSKKIEARTFTDAKRVVGKKAIFKFQHRPQGTVKLEVRIKDIKTAYGKHSFLVEPISGQGEIWVRNLQMA